MALARRLVEVKNAGKPAYKGLHLDLLQVIADHGREASAAECIGALQYLRDARDAVKERFSRNTAAPKQPLQQWVSECRQHNGFSVLRDRLLSDSSLRALSGEELSRVYNQLKRMNLQTEAEIAWPVVKTRVEEGALSNTQELLGVWSVAPAEHLPVLDHALAEALRSAGVRTWQLLSAISRASDKPNSQTVSKCAEQLSERLSDLASDDLALLAAQLGTRLHQDLEASEHAQLRGLMRRAKKELVSRDGSLETAQLVGLLGVLEGVEDGLWLMLRKQLLAKLKSSPDEFSAPQALEVFRVFQKEGVPESELRFVGKRLESLLNRAASPNLVAMVSRSLDIVIASQGVCQSLFNAAVRLRDDLYPTVLWGLFTRAGDVELVVRYPDLQVRVQRVGDTLERHGVKKQKMTLREIRGAVLAMRANGVVLRKCLTQMTQQFLDVHEEVNKNVGETRQDLQQQNTSTAIPTAGEATTPETMPNNKDKVTDDTSLVSDLLGEVQGLMISFWAQTRLLGIEEESLTATVQKFCTADGPCQVEAIALVDYVRELEAVPGPEAVALKDGLLRHLRNGLPRLSNSALVEVANVASTSKVLQGAVAYEIGRRFRVQYCGDDGASTCPTGVAELSDLCSLLTRYSRWSWAAIGEETSTGTVRSSLSLATAALEDAAPGRVATPAPSKPVLENTAKVDAGAATTAPASITPTTPEKQHNIENVTLGDGALATDSTDSLTAAAEAEAAHEAEELAAMKKAEVMEVDSAEKDILEEAVVELEVAAIAAADLREEEAVTVEAATATDDTPQATEAAAGAARAVIGSLSGVLPEHPDAARKIMADAALALSGIAASMEPPLRLNRLWACLNEEAAHQKPAWELPAAAELAFNFTVLLGGRVPFDIAARLWLVCTVALRKTHGEAIEIDGGTAARSNVLALSCEQQFKLWSFILAARHLSTYTAYLALRLSPDAVSVENVLVALEQRSPVPRMELEDELAATEVVAELRKALPEIAPNDHCEERFRVPGTPYVADFAFPHRQLLLIVPRSSHRAPGVRSLGGRGQLMERTLQAMGWDSAWIWPEDDGVDSGNFNVQRLQDAFGDDSRPDPSSSSVQK